MRPPGNITRLHAGGTRHVASFEYSVRQHLERLLDSSHFDASARSREFLCYVVDEVLAGRGADLNQGSIAVTVFGRRSDFDPILDPIVRVQAGRLRRSLERYYLLGGNDEPIHIELRKGSYAPVFVTVAAGETEPVEVRPVTLTRAVPDWPTVVIHPFALSLAEDKDLVGRMKDTLTMELCRYGDVRVVRQGDLDKLDLKQQAGVRFELRGALRRNADGCLVSARLIDRTTGELIWGDEYHTRTKAGRWSSHVDDVPRIIAASVGSEQGAIARALLREAATQDAPGDFAAILRSHHFFFARQVSDVVPAIEALRQLTVRQPEIASAWMWLARLCMANYSFELSGLHTPIEQAISHAYQALLLDPTSARVRCVLAAALLVKGELQAARDELELALRLNPESFVYREIIGWLVALAGDWERGVSLMRDAMERNPYCLPHVRHGLWADHLRRGEYGEAYVDALEYRDPCFFWRELMTACCLGHLGRHDDARASAALLLRAKPDFETRGRTLIGYYIKMTELQECVIAGLRKAGLQLS